MLRRGPLHTVHHQDKWGSACNSAWPLSGDCITVDVIEQSEVASIARCGYHTTIPPYHHDFKSLSRSTSSIARCGYHTTIPPYHHDFKSPSRSTL